MNRTSWRYTTGLMAGVGLISLFAGAAQAQDEPMFEVYGFAQLDYIQDFNRVDPAWDATLRPSKIPTVDGQFGDDGQTIFSARQSRLGVHARHPVGGKSIYAKFEFDLYGTGVDAGQTTMRVRHAYGEWGSFLAGQTNTLFMDIDTFPNTIDYWGPNGMVFIRNPQLRYTWKTASGHFAVAIEQPGDDIDVGRIRELDPALGNSIVSNEELPDLTAQWRHNGGWGHFQVAGVLRSIGYNTVGTPNNEPKSSEFGWGINVSGNFKTMGRDVLHLSAVYGEGIASYMNDGGMDLGPAARPGVAPPIVGAPIPPGSLTGEPVPLLGLVAYYDHYWNDAWSSSVGWSMVDVDNTNFQDPTAFNEAQYASVNVLYQPDPKFMVGAELLWGSRKDFDESRSGSDTRIQFSAKYSFTSKDFIR